jgi:hypothetical protein
VQLARWPATTPALQALALGMCAAIARGAGIAVQLPGNGSYTVIVLLHAGNGDAVFRLKLAVVRRGRLHLQTLQAGRCCTSLSNPPNVAFEFRLLALR